MKKLVFILLLVILLTACQQATPEPTVTMTDVPTMTETVTQTVTDTPTLVNTIWPTKKGTWTQTATATITPPFWEQYPEGTLVPVQTVLPETNRDDYWVKVENYSEISEDVPEYPKNDLKNFLFKHEHAVVVDSKWIYDPIIIAMRISGYPNIDNIFPDEIQVYQPDEDHIIILVFLYHTHDDSIRDVENRVDLVKEDNHWLVEWYGVRWRCQLNRGHQDWGKEFCH